MKFTSLRESADPRLPAVDKSDPWAAAANRALGKLGMRLAESAEPGWYTMVSVDGEPATRAWVTEAWGTVDKHGRESWSDEDDDADIRDLYLGSAAFDDSPHGQLPCKFCGKTGCGCAQRKSEEAGSAPCLECGGLKTEGTCECAMNEREASDYDFDGSGMDLDTKRAQAAGKGREDARYPIDDPRREHTPVEESSLRRVVAGIVRGMKLSVAGGGHFDFGQKDDDDDVAAFLLHKKADEKEKQAPAPEKSGTKLSTKRRRPKSSQYR